MMWNVFSILLSVALFFVVTFLLKLVLAGDKRKQYFCHHHWGDWVEEDAYLHANDYFDRLRLASEGQRLIKTCEKCGKRRTRWIG